MIGIRTFFDKFLALAAVALIASTYPRPALASDLAEPVANEAKADDGKVKTGKADAAKPESKKPAARKPTMEENPTVDSGRGTPTLDALHAPAAWIYIDRNAGEFIEENGRPQIQWVVYDPVSRNPSFRVDCLSELLGEADEFRCVFSTHESFDGTSVLYTIQSRKGRFKPGKEYALLEPGEDFEVMDQKTGKKVERVPLLAPGIYRMVGSVKNTKTNKEALAISQFTVGSN